MAAVLTTANVPFIANASEPLEAGSQKTDGTEGTADQAGNGQSDVGAEGTKGNDGAAIGNGAGVNNGENAGGETDAGGVLEENGDLEPAPDAGTNGSGAGGTDEDKTDGEAETGSETDDKKDEKEEDKDKDDADDKKESGNVVTLGENLSDSQRASMYEYFGADEDKVKTIVVTHADEMKYMEGIATDEQIGTSTNSCAYVEPTDSGGIKVKTANLNFVTSAMIASTLTTAGMENCNVIAACPFEVSGTGALTGIIMAYETASGEDLDEGQKAAAVEELMTTGEIADTVGTKKATEVMNDVKTEVLDKGLTDAGEIADTVEDIAKDNEASLTDEQKEQIVELMEKISQYDYDVQALKKTFDNLTGEDGALSNIWNSIKSFFVGSGDGILNDTNDEALGGDIITDSTEEEGGFKDDLITRIKNFFTGGDEE